jgi:hypothetical protein
LLAALPFMQGSSCLGVKDVTSAIEQVNQTLSQAVTMLSNQSSAWQSTLKDLESQLAKDATGLETKIADDVHDMINQVDTVVKDGIQFTQESLNCQTDIFGSHARIAIKNMLTSFLNRWNYRGVSDRPLEPLVPIVCSVNPNAINVAKWDPTVQLILSGTDFNLFNTTPPVASLLHANGTPKAVPATLVSVMTNYRVAINVPAMINQGLFDPDIVQLTLKWNGRDVNPNMIPVVSSAPPPACGQRDQPCCNGGTCTAGGSGPVCSRNVCRAYITNASGRTGALSGGGGGGGSAFGPDWCAVGSVAVGLSGRSGSEIDGLQLICARVALDGSLSGNDSTPFHGGDGGGGFFSVCPGGQVLTGLAGRTGSLTDQVQGLCAAITQVVGLGGGTSTIGPWGGGGGSPYAGSCPSGMAITGLSGRSGTLLDQMHFHCAPVTLQ